VGAAADTSPVRTVAPSEVGGGADAREDVTLADVLAAVEQLRAEVAAARTDQRQTLAMAVHLGKQVAAWDEVLATLANGSVGRALALIGRRKGAAGD
jgi:hypothetical protein